LKSDKVDIDPDELAIVKKIVQTCLPPDIKVWVFGSRATFKAKKYSDLDIALESSDGSLVSSVVINTLEHEFEESDLPWKVDVIDINTVNDTFRKIIDHDKILPFS